MKRTVVIVALFLGLSAAGFSQTSDVTGTIFLGDGREMKIDNPNVTIVPGEYITIHTDAMNKQIVVKDNGEYIGKIGGIGGGHVGQSSGARIKVVGTDNASYESKTIDDSQAADDSQQ